MDVGASSRADGSTPSGASKFPPTSFLTPGLEKTYTSENPVWQRLFIDASVETAKKLPQAVLQPWQLKVARYWQKPDRSDVVWMLEVLNATPLLRDGAEAHLLMYREAWCPPSSPDRTDNANLEFVDKLVKILLTAMVEGGNIAARHSAGALDLGVLPSDYFTPRRPGIIGVDEKLSPFVGEIKSRLSCLNIIVGVFNEDGFGPDANAKLLRLYETQGNTILERGGEIEIRCLSKEERREAYLNGPDYWKDAEDYIDLYPSPEDLTRTESGWEREGYASLEEALEYNGEEKRSILERETPAWEADGYTSLEEACMDAYKAKSIEEAFWDAVGVPRLVCLNKNAGDKLKAAGWRYIGYKPGRDYELNEDTIKRRHRVVLEGAGGGAWEES